MTNEDALAQFKANMTMIRHLVGSVSDASQAEFFFRELDQECHKLVPKFRPDSKLKREFVPNTLQNSPRVMVDSASGKRP